MAILPRFLIYILVNRGYLDRKSYYEGPEAAKQELGIGYFLRGSLALCHVPGLGFIG